MHYGEDQVVLHSISRSRLEQIEHFYGVYVRRLSVVSIIVIVRVVDRGPIPGVQSTVGTAVTPVVPTAVPSVRVVLVVIVVPASIEAVLAELVTRTVLEIPLIVVRTIVARRVVPVPAEHPHGFLQESLVLSANVEVGRRGCDYRARRHGAPVAGSVLVH